MIQDSNLLRPAVFLDRDGTVNVEVHYLSDPDQVELLPKVAETISMLNARGIPVVVVTNQAGIARGYFEERQLSEIHQRLFELLGRQNAKLDGVYFCPHHPTEGLGDYRVACGCRKPQPGMLMRASLDLGIDLGRSLMIGDREGDLQAGATAGCQTALVLTGYGQETMAAIDLGKVRGLGAFSTVADAVNAWMNPS